MNHDAQRQKEIILTNLHCRLPVLPWQCKMLVDERNWNGTAGHPLRVLKHGLIHFKKNIISVWWPDVMWTCHILISIHPLITCIHILLIIGSTFSLVDRSCYPAVFIVFSLEQIQLVLTAFVHFEAVRMQTLTKSSVYVSVSIRHKLAKLMTWPPRVSCPALKHILYNPIDNSTRKKSSSPPTQCARCLCSSFIPLSDPIHVTGCVITGCVQVGSGRVCVGGLMMIHTHYHTFADWKWRKRTEAIFSQYIPWE